MATTSNTILFNVRNAVDFYNPVKDIVNNQIYIFAAKNLPWPGLNPSTITNNDQEIEYGIYEELIFGKLVNPEDISYMIDRHDWVSGTTYDAYDDIVNLETKTYFVVSYEAGNYHVFKCLDNAGGIPSTSQPLFSQTGASDMFYITADGYHWKYMYTLDAQTYNKFTTTQYIPVTVNTSVQSFAKNGSIDSILITSGSNNYYSYATGSFTQISVGGNTLIHGISSGSANNNFFTGSAIYISTGTGSGQVREITGYSVSGSQYYVTVDSVFNPQPDLSSTYQIAPNVKIFGDGSGAKAISTVNAMTKSISNITVVNNGINYTYANVQIIGNTGTIQANSAVARAIIAPYGGHGSDIISELNANKLGFSVTFANSESGNISTQNDFSRIGLLRGPKLSNVELTCANSNLFLAGENVVQYIGVNSAVNMVSTQVNKYNYGIQNYVKLNLTAATSLVANDSIYQTSPSTANGVVVNVSGNTIIVRQDIGAFNTSSTILKLGTPTVNNVINTISAGFTNTVFGLDSSNTLFAWSATNDIDVFINSNKIYNRAVLPSTSNAISFSVNSTAILLYNKTLANTDVITINKFITTATRSNSQYKATGTVVSANSTVLKLSNVSGQFITSATIYGLQSGYSNNVTAVNGPYTLFNQTLKLSGVQTGANVFQLDDYCYQGTPGNGGAYGYIHSIDAPVGGGNTTYNFYLTGVKGTFQTGSSIQSANGDKVASISAIKAPDLVKYSGNILYVENIASVNRANSQSEKVQIVLKFY